VQHDYHDHSMDKPTVDSFVSDDDVEEYYENGGRKGPRGGVNVPFPTKLHVMLTKVEEDGSADIVSWQPHGRSFIIHKPREFVEQIMPEYFRQSKLTSFQRQLNLYGFRRLTAGDDRGGYYHELFLRHKLFLCQNMTRMRIKGTGIKGKASPETEPNFYAMPTLKPDSISSAKNINQKLELEVISAIEEEHGSKPPAAKPRSRPRRSTPRKKLSVDVDSVCSADDVHSSAESELPVLVTPESRRPKPQVSFTGSADNTSMSTEILSRGSYTRRPLYMNRSTNQNKMDCRLPFMSSYSDEGGSSTHFHQDDVIDIGREHFHYMDPFSLVQATEGGACHQLQPYLPSEPTVSESNAEPRNLSALSLPHLVSSLCDDLCKDETSFDLSFDEPILSPSSSLSSLHENVDLSKDTRFNPDTIFSAEVEDAGWGLDIDAEISLMG